MPAPAESVSEPMPPAFVRHDPDSVRIGFDGESILAVIHAVPAHV